MRTMLVLGFPYATSADAAAQDLLLQEPDVAAGPDAVAVVSCDDDGAFHVTTNHTLGAGGYRFFWHLVLTALIFLPGSGGLGDRDLRIFSRRLEALGFDESFQDRLREMLAPDTSALFMLATQPVPADALTVLGRFGGKVLAASLVPDVEDQIMGVFEATRGFSAVPADADGADEASPAPASLGTLPQSRRPADPDVSSGPDETSADRHNGTP